MGTRRAAWAVATRGPSCRSTVLDRRYPAGRRPPACVRQRCRALGSMVFGLFRRSRASPRLNPAAIMRTVAGAVNPGIPAMPPGGSLDCGSCLAAAARLSAIHTYFADCYLPSPADQRDSLKIMNGKVVIITGAFGTLGRVVAGKVSRLGARIVLIDKAPNPPAELRHIAAGDCECISN